MNNMYKNYFIDTLNRQAKLNKGIYFEPEDVKMLLNILTGNEPKKDDNPIKISIREFEDIPKKRIRHTLILDEFVGIKLPMGPSEKGSLFGVTINIKNDPFGIFD